MGLSEPSYGKAAVPKNDWWDPNGSFFLLHMINPVRFEYFSGKAKEKLGGVSGKRVLDIGCGGGLLSERFADGGAAVTGLDVSPSAIDAAKVHAVEVGLDIHYRASTLDEFMKGDPRVFDCVVCSEVLEHVDGLPGFLKSACSLLRGGGLFFFSTINRTLKARLLTVFVAEDMFKIIPCGTHDFRRFIRPSQLVSLLEGQSVSVEDIRGMSMDFTRLEFGLSRNTSVNYLGYGIKGC